MTDEELAAIQTLVGEAAAARARLRAVPSGLGYGPPAPMMQAAVDLLAEVERLRAENAALETQLGAYKLWYETDGAQLRAIAEAVAAVAVDEQRQVERCMYCSCWFTGWPISHASNCPVTKARALLGQGERGGERYGIQG